MPTWKEHLRSLIRLEKTNEMAPSIEITGGASSQQMRRRIKVGSLSSDTLRLTCQGGSCQDIKARRLFRLPVSSSVPQLTVLLNFEILSYNSNQRVRALFWVGKHYDHQPTN